jgi:hypothetical protein
MVYRRLSAVSGILSSAAAIDLIQLLDELESQLKIKNKVLVARLKGGLHGNSTSGD